MKFGCHIAVVVQQGDYVFHIIVHHFLTSVQA